MRARPSRFWKLRLPCLDAVFLYLASRFLLFGGVLVGANHRWNCQRGRCGTLGALLAGSYYGRRFQILERADYGGALAALLVGIIGLNPTGDG